MPLSSCFLAPCSEFLMGLLAKIEHKLPYYDLPFVNTTVKEANFISMHPFVIMVINFNL